MNSVEVSIFCGGRGSAAIIKGLLSARFKRINVIINTYDDGLSTGAIRKLITGIIGPSDVRKNVNTYLKCKNQESLSRFLDYRLPHGSPLAVLKAVIRFLEKGETIFRRLPPALEELRNILAELNHGEWRGVIFYLHQFWRHAHEKHKTVDISDFSMGNIIFAGIYLVLRDNDKAIECYTGLFINDPGFRIYTINNNGSSTLCALKTNGILLPNECSISADKSDGKISGLFLLKQPLTDGQIKAIKENHAKDEILRLLSDHPVISNKADMALQASDIIIYGPGTQHSSLFPSYMTKGVREAIHRNRNAMKVFVLNLRLDNDIRSFSAQDVLSAFKKYMDCPDGMEGYVDHILYTPLAEKEALIGADEVFGGAEGGIGFTKGDFTDKNNRRSHDGDSVVKTILKLYKDHGNRPTIKPEPHAERPASSLDRTFKVR